MLSGRFGSYLRRGLPRLRSNRDGATAVEFAIVVMLLVVFTFILIEFSLALYQWHAAEKATHFGARMAIVSDPVAIEFTAWTGKDATNKFGQRPMPFPAGNKVVCNDPVLTCSEGFTFSQAAHTRIVDAMRRAFGGTSRIMPENVVVEYEDAGLCFVGRPGGPCPAVTVKLQNLEFRWIVLDSLLGLGPITMPAFSTTLTGEDMSNVLL